MIPYSAPLEDILTSLSAAGAADLPEWDGDLMRQLGEAFATFAEEGIAPLSGAGDAEGARLEAGQVRMPSGYGAAYAEYIAQGWPGLTAPEAMGGQGLGGVALAIVSEIFSGADISMQMVTGLMPGAIRVLTQFGTQA